MPSVNSFFKENICWKHIVWIQICHYIPTNDKRFVLTSQYHSTYSCKHRQNHVIYWLVYDWTGFASKFILITILYTIKTHEIHRNSSKLDMHQIQYVFWNFGDGFGIDIGFVMLLPVSWTFQLSYVNIVDHHLASSQNPKSTPIL